MEITKQKFPDNLKSFNFPIRVSKKYHGFPLKLKIDFIRRSKPKPILKLEDFDFDAFEHDLFTAKLPEILPLTPSFTFALTITPLLTLTSI